MQLFISLVVFSCMLFNIKAEPEYFVSVDGSDDWDGKRPVHGDGASGPWMTLQNAIEKLRQIRPAIPAILMIMLHSTLWKALII